MDSEKASRDGREGRAAARPTPPAPSPPSAAVPILTVTKNNELYLCAKKVEVANLEAELQKALTDGNSETLLIRGDKSVLLGAAVDIMSIAKQAGAKHIAILTQPGK